MEELAPIAVIVPQQGENEAKYSGTYEDREQGTEVDIARIEMVYRFAVTCNHDSYVTDGACRKLDRRIIPGIVS